MVAIASLPRTDLRVYEEVYTQVLNSSDEVLVGLRTKVADLISPSTIGAHSSVMIANATKRIAVHYSTTSPPLRKEPLLSNPRGDGTFATNYTGSFRTTLAGFVKGTIEMHALGEWWGRRDRHVHDESKKKADWFAGELRLARECILNNSEYLAIVYR